MSPRTLGPCFVLVLATVSVAQQLAQDLSVRELVYRLVDPRGRLQVKERLLDAGRAAVPHLIKAVEERNFPSGNRSWTDVNQIPELAELSGEAIVQQAVVAALHVLQELGSDAIDITTRVDPESGWPQSSWGTSHWDLRGRSFEGFIRGVVASIAIHDVDAARKFGLQLHRSSPLETVISSVREFHTRQCGEMRFFLACQILRQRVREVVSDRKMRRDLLRHLRAILRRHKPVSSMWPLLKDHVFYRDRGRAYDWKSYEHTLIHDHASLLLARLEPRDPLALRGNMILLGNIRRHTRLEAALELGKRGAAAGPAAFVLIERLRDPVARVQQATITSLGLIGPAAKAAIPHLRLLVGGKDEKLALVAKAALRSVDPEPSNVWTYYHFNGKKYAEGKCEGTTKIGHWTYWYFDGTKQWEGEYVDGRMHGAWTHWCAQGVRRYEYDRGTLITK